MWELKRELAGRREMLCLGLTRAQWAMLRPVKCAEDRHVRWSLSMSARADFVALVSGIRVSNHLLSSIVLGRFCQLVIQLLLQSLGLLHITHRRRGELQLIHTLAWLIHSFDNILHPTP